MKVHFLVLVLLLVHSAALVPRATRLPASTSRLLQSRVPPRVPQVVQVGPRHRLATSRACGDDDDDAPATWSADRLEEEKRRAQARQKQQAGVVGNAVLALVVSLTLRLACAPAAIRREYICPAAIGGASQLPTDRSVFGGDCTPAGELLRKILVAPVALPFSDGYWTQPLRVGGAPV